VANLWARLTGRIRRDEQQQVDDLAGLPPSERARFQESPDDHVQDQRAAEALGGQPGATPDPDDPSGLLSGPTS
jgi:hypothetical protein